MNSIFLLFDQVILAHGKVIESARKFIQWTLAGAGALTTLLISNGTQAAELIGRTGLVTLLTLIAISMLCGFVAIIATNAIEGFTVGHISLKQFIKTEEWANQVASEPFDRAVYFSTYLSLFFGPLKWWLRRIVGNQEEENFESDPRAGLRPYHTFGNAISTFVFSALLQIAFAAIALFWTVYCLWCHLPKG